MRYSRQNLLDWLGTLSPLAHQPSDAKSLDHQNSYGSTGLYEEFLLLDNRALLHVVEEPLEFLSYASRPNTFVPIRATTYIPESQAQGSPYWLTNPRDPAHTTLVGLWIPKPTWNQALLHGTLAKAILLAAHQALSPENEAFLSAVADLARWRVCQMVEQDPLSRSFVATVSWNGVVRSARAQRFLFYDRNSSAIDPSLDQRLAYSTLHGGMPGLERLSTARWSLSSMGLMPIPLKSIPHSAHQRLALKAKILQAFDTMNLSARDWL